MPPRVDQAVVLRHWEFSETSQTVALFCRDAGVVRGLAKGARREKGAFCGGFEALTRGEIVYIVRPTSELALLTEWDLQHIYWPARRDLRAHRISLYLIDLVHHTVTDHDPHPDLFDALHGALDSLGDGSAHAPTLASFQWRLLVETGYQPRLTDDPLPRNATLGFNASDGAIVPDPGVGGAGPALWRVRGSTVAALRSVAEDAAIEDSAALRRANRLLAAYIRALIDKDLPTRAALFESK